MNHTASKVRTTRMGALPAAVEALSRPGRRGRRPLIRPLLVAALAVPLLGAGQGAAQASEPGYYQVVNQSDGLCLEVTGARMYPSAAVGALHCVDGGNQQWTPVALGNGFYQLRVLHTDMCLNVGNASYRNDEQIVQYPCEGVANEQWRLVYRGAGYYEMVARHSGKCLDKSHWNVVQYSCNNASWQRWRFR